MSCIKRKGGYKTHLVYFTIYRGNCYSIKNLLWIKFPQCPKNRDIIVHVSFLCHIYTFNENKIGASKIRKFFGFIKLLILLII